MEFIKSTLDEIKIDLIKSAKEYGLRIIGLLVLLLIGLKVIKILVNMTEAALKKSKVDISLAKFLVSFVRLGLKISLIILILNGLIKDMTPILTIGAAAGIGAGMALQGSLANFTGGILILLFRPFSVGDYISEKAFGNEGKVEEIQVLYTTLLTVDNKTVIIPNGQLANSSIVNFTRAKVRRVDLDFKAAYSEDTNKVKEAILEAVQQHPLTIKEKDIFVNVKEYGDYEVTYSLWVWCDSINYIKVKYDLIEDVKKKFDEKGINIPYPQMEVKIKQ